jgi:crotonobetainyl-CoA:carnitine CoA-transferase CaiB-like acyl-CoA transferase
MKQTLKDLLQAIATGVRVNRVAGKAHPVSFGHHIAKVLSLPGPLSHIRVLDLSRIVAGPWASQILADLGADVIKVEKPGTGDDTRSWGPPFLEDHEGKSTDNSGYFLAVNRGKRSITIDMATPEGQQLIRELAAQSDVVLENFKVGTLTRFGLGPENLRTLNPRLVYVSISGFGQDGPRSSQPAYDFMVQAMGGLMSVTGEAEGNPGAGPQKVGVPIVDIMTGMYAAVAVLAALERRHETGRGDFIDLALLDVQVAFLANQAMNYLLSDKVPVRNGNKHPNIQPQDVFQCRDGYIALACGNDGQFRKLAQVLGKPSLSTDDRFTTNANRVRNYPAMREALSEIFAAKNVAETVQLLNAEGIPCGPINSIPQALNDPQIQHRQMVRDLDHPLGAVPQVVSPMRFQESPLSFDIAPPLLGQHTHEILTNIGLRPDEIESLQTRRII